jgi:nitroreductase/NAD-dependent dihydropyrimidine dehydrogenase PreA subunit
MMNVDTKKCIGCGKCVDDCFPRDIEIIHGKAKINNLNCIKCGHCIAICPKGAVSTDEYDMKDVKDYNKEDFIIDADNLLNFIKFRRSIRQFKDKEVKEKKILKIIEAGRFTQTSSNLQDVSYIVVKDSIQEVKALTLESLKKMGEDILNDSTSQNMLFKRYAKIWIEMYEQFQENSNKKDRLFFNAPALIIVTANSEINGALASSNMELMTNALGLGTFFSGFFVRAAKGNKKIMDFVGVKEGKQIVTCMVIGYPEVEYLRTVPRKVPDISWK